MHRSLIFFLAFYQANACLDLLVRTFNEVFSPMIETGDGRIRKPHNVDDLTNYYDIDESGNVMPNIDHDSVAHTRFNGIKSDQDNEEMLLSPRSRTPVTNGFTVEETNTMTNPDTTTNAMQNIISPSSAAPEVGVTKKYRNRGGYYAPGKRPFVDFLISLIETFQLGSDSKLISYRPRYENGQIHYDT